MARPPQEPKQRFLKFVDVADSGCHEFRSTVQKDGYARFYFKGRQYPAHRAAYELFVGEIPKGLLVCHKCDNRKCVNIEHLFLGSYQDNCLDMHNKGRANTRRTITDEQILGVKSLGETGISQQAIADKTGIHQTTISRILRGTFKYLNTFS